MAGTLSYQQVLKNAAVVCSKSEKCTSEMTASLRQWGLSDEEITTGIDFLVTEKFINDQRYALNYVHDKFRFNKWGKVKIAYMLRQKRIAEHLISESLEAISDVDYEKTIVELLKAKAKSIKAVSEYEIKGKLAVFAQSRGFDSDISYRIANEIIADQTEH
jgi:regulatory protein